MDEETSLLWFFSDLLDVLRKSIGG